MEPMHQRVAGIDVHRMKHVVTLLIGREDGAVSSETREFGEAASVAKNAPRWIRALKKYGYWPRLLPHRVQRQAGGACARLPCAPAFGHLKSRWRIAGAERRMGYGPLLGPKSGCATVTANLLRFIPLLSASHPALRATQA